MYQAIIFDCDGVIVDTENLSNTLYKNALSKLGLHLSDAELHHHFSGFTTEHNLKKSEELLGRPLPSDFADTLKTEFYRVISESLPTIEGVRELLQEIKVPIAMATNARREEMEFKLEKTQLAERFSVRFCVDDVAQPKPAPDLYLAAANALGVDPQYCLVIEDSIAGVQAGTAAGMSVHAYSETMDETLQKQAGAVSTNKTMRALSDQLRTLKVI